MWLRVAAAFLVAIVLQVCEAGASEWVGCGSPVSGIAGESKHCSEEGVRHFVPHAKYPKAQCLDGSPPAVYIRRSTSHKWLIYLEGWGFCSDLEDCRDRSFTQYGTTQNEAPTTDLRDKGPHFNSDPEANPLLHDFNWVFVRYCDGGYFTGDVEHPVNVHGTPIMFRGRYIREAVVDFLKHEHGMKSAKEVILSGCSSAGITSLFSVDIWRDLMDWVPRFTAFADSGYFLGVDAYVAGKEFIYKHQNSHASLNRHCLKEHTHRPWACFIPENSLPHSRTPVFAWQSRYDTNQIDCDTRRCWNDYGDNIVSSMKHVLRDDLGHGFYIDACSRHCWWPARRPFMRVHGRTPLVAHHLWYNGGDVNRTIQPGAYPCHSCCGDEEVLFA